MKSMAMRFLKCTIPLRWLLMCTVPLLCLLLIFRPAGPYPVYAGAAEQQVRIIPDPDNGTSYSDFGLYRNGGDGALTTAPDGITVEIDNPGDKGYALQLACSGIPFLQGSRYIVRFDITCSISGEVSYLFREIDGDRTVFRENVIPVSRESFHVEDEWSMQANSDPCSVFLLNLGNLGKDKTPGGYTVSVRNFELICLSADASAGSFLPEYPSLVLNQIGFRPSDEKLCYVKDLPDQREFLVKTADTDQAVYEGVLEEAVNDPVSGSQIRCADFSEFRDAGEYYISLPDGSRSFSFRIAGDVYHDLFEGLLHMLYLQRCGAPLPADCAGEFAHDACHTAKALIPDSDHTKDVSGGWHDAGDFGRYVVPGAKTVMDLLLAFERYPMCGDDSGIPESGNGIPDLLDEARYELEWMMKMQDEESGGVHHQVTNLRFPPVMNPEENTEPLYLAPVSDAATADFCAAACAASTVYAGFDEDFAQELRHRACMAWDYLKDRGPGVGFAGFDGLDAAQYKDDDVRDEIFWAAVEMYLRTDGIVSLQEVLDRYNPEAPVEPGWSNALTYALYDMARYGGESGEDEKAPAFSAVCRERLLREAEALMELCQGDVYHMAFGTDYYWGSNMRAADNGALLQAAYEWTGDEDFRLMAKRQMDYILGLNNLGYCFVTGMGSFSPSFPHHNISQSLGKPVPGMVVGGVNSRYSDDYARAVLRGAAPAMCYVDHERSYSTNEPAIYYNSALTALTACFLQAED